LQIDHDGIATPFTVTEREEFRKLMLSPLPWITASPPAQSAVTLAALCDIVTPCACAVSKHASTTMIAIMQRGEKRWRAVNISAPPARGIRKENFRRQSLTDALAIFEVLSDDTATTDRVEKLIDYAAVPSRRSYVVLEQTAVAGTLFRRDPGGAWIASAHTTGALVLPGLDITLPLADMYQGLTFAV
jgi:hypothetical protein